MTYQYSCPNERCAHTFDVIKHHSRMTDEERCPMCQTVSIREFIPQRLQFFGTKVEHPEWNPGLGCVVKGKKHRNELAKQRGLVEVGNEKPETLQKHFENERAERYKKSWEDA